MNIAARIRAVGKATGRYERKNVPVCEVPREGCETKIRSDNPIDVEYVKAKRGSELFFHTECRENVWQRKMM